LFAEPAPEGEEVEPLCAQIVATARGRRSFEEAGEGREVASVVLDGAGRGAALVREVLEIPTDLPAKRRIGRGLGGRARGGGHRRSSFAGAAARATFPVALVPRSRSSMVRETMHPSGSHHGSVDLLVLAAYAPELGGMRRLLGEQLYGNVSGVVVSCKAVGVGIPNAAAGTTARLLQLRPRAAILVGTCGAYPSAGLSIGDAFVVRRAHLVDGSEVEGRGAMPDPMARSVECNAMISLGLGAGKTPNVDAANTLVVTTDDVLAAQIGPATGCALENLEVFAFANACALQSIPFAAVLGVSNRVGSTGREEWRAHHKAASTAACEIVNRWLTTGAMGLPHA
jgi:futalosine hydrolase